jgi:hypothetical protein
MDLQSNSVSETEAGRISKQTQGTSSASAFAFFFCFFPLWEA